MSLEIHLRIEHNELLLEAFSVWAREVVFLKVQLKRIVVDIILLLSAAFSAVTDMATLVLVPAMCVQLVVSIEALPTEAALRVTLETTLIDSARVVVAELLVLSQLSKREELVFVGEDFLVSRTQIARTS